MSLSPFLSSRMEALSSLIRLLGERYDYVSVLGCDAKTTAYRADKNASLIREAEYDRGFVAKLQKDGAFFEYSFDDVPDDLNAFAELISAELKPDPAYAADGMRSPTVSDEPATGDFVRENDFAEYDDARILDFCRKLSADALAQDSRVLNAIGFVSVFEVSKIFLSRNRRLTQNYGWANGRLMVVLQDGKMAEATGYADSNNLSDIFQRLEGEVAETVERAGKLAHATPIQPGFYDIITDPSITGLIAHEAFGHGVEMDQFVKDRALAKEYVGKPVASSLINMRDGAASAVSVASYFFDDDGVLAGDTQIIRDGILVAGLSDLTSSAELGVRPTGNGRRDSHTRKAYARMTNTYFEAGNSTLEEMIASVKHGYMLFQTNNGMEDPKNWQIQCAAEYGIEIVDGKLTDHYVSPVVMSGYVPDLLQSISMVSGDIRIDGSGYCGKGYKEWVRVSDGGPNLKAKVKLG